MSSIVYGQLAGRPVSSAAARSHQTAGRFSAAAATPLPAFACGAHRSLSTVHPVPALSSSALAGWPNVPLHLQRKVLTWSRGPNAAEEAVAPPPSALAAGATAAAAVGDDIATQLNSGAVTFGLNGSSSSSTGGVPEAVAEPDLAEAITAAASIGGSDAGLAGAAVTAAEQSGNGVVAAAPAELVLEDAAAVAAEELDSVGSNGNGAPAAPSSTDAAAAAAAAPVAAAQDVVEASEASVSAPAAVDAADAAPAAAEATAPAEPAAVDVAVPEPASAAVEAPAPAAAAVVVPPPVSPTEAEEAAAAESLAAEAAAAAEAEAGAAAAAASSSSDASSAGGSDAPSSSSSSEGSVGGNGFGGPAIRLVLSSGAAMLPHPDKASRGGEDSFFIADHQAAVGVADGVGGWAEIGVDAGAYARLLMVHAKEAADAAADEVAAGTLSAQAILESAFYRTNVQGSSTACVLVVNGTTLSASNLGDSGFVLVRDGVATFQCPQQQHNFNFPFQLGSADSMSDQPQAAMRFELQVQPGDIVVTGSDGLWDNIFAEEAATIASKCRDKGETATTAAQVLCRYARMRASDAKYHSPFSYAAIQAGYVYLGGKMDDITVVVSYVSLPSRV